MERLKALGDRFCLQTHVDMDSQDVPTPADEAEKASAVACPSVGFIFGEEVDAGLGTLHVTSRRVIWVSSERPDLAFVLRYPQIMMHAVSRDTSTFPRQCIYIQIDDGSEDMRQGGEESEEESEPDAEVSAEVRLVPQDAAKIDEIFKLLCEYAALNPDSDAEAEGEGDFFFDESEVYAGLSDEMRAQLVASRMQGAMALDEEEEEGETEGAVDGELGGQDDSRFEDDEEEGAPAAANGHS